MEIHGKQVAKCDRIYRNNEELLVNYKVIEKACFEKRKRRNYAFLSNLEEQAGNSKLL